MHLRTRWLTMFWLMQPILAAILPLVLPITRMRFVIKEKLK